jgi:hypothetical protein
LMLSPEIIVFWCPFTTASEPNTSFPDPEMLLEWPDAKFKSPSTLFKWPSRIFFSPIIAFYSPLTRFMPDSIEGVILIGVASVEIIWLWGKDYTGEIIVDVRGVGVTKLVSVTKVGVVVWTVGTLFEF